MTISKKLLAALIILILLLSFGLAICYNLWQKDKANYKGIVALNQKMLNDCSTYYRAKNGELVSRQKDIQVTVVDLKNTNDALTQELKNIKEKPSKVQYIIQTVEHTAIHDSIHHDSIKGSNSVVFADSSNRWYRIKGLARINSTNITSLSIIDTCYTVQGMNGSIMVAHKNPYILTTNILGVQVKRPAPFFRKFWVDVGIGAIGTAIGLHYLGVKP